MSRPQNSCRSYSNHKTRPLGPQKEKNEPKVKSNFNVIIQGIIENESCSTTCIGVSPKGAGGASAPPGGIDEG